MYKMYRHIIKSCAFRDPFKLLLNMSVSTIIMKWVIQIGQIEIIIVNLWLKVCPKSADDSVNVPALTPKKLIAYKRGMALKKAAALAAFQQVFNITCISNSCFG